MKRTQRGGKGGRKAQRHQTQKADYGYQEWSSEDEAEKEKVLTEDQVAVLIEKQYRELVDLPKYFGTLHADTRTALKAAFENDEIPDAGEHLGELREVKLVYEAKKAWDDAAAMLAETEYLAGGIADSELVVLFMSIGNGDCIFVRTPGGNVIVIDCGSRKRPAKGYRERIADVLTTHFLKTAGKQDKKPELYAVILTHADQDHYNELAAILDPHIEGIRHLFHSDELTAYTINPKDPTPLQEGRKKVVANKYVTEEFLRSKSAFRNKVTINSTAVTLTKSGSADAVPYVVDQNAKTIKILDEDWNGAKTEIILLGGGVAENTEVNRQVMAADTRLGRKAGVNRDRFLLCGDATYLTEVFLLNNHNNAITNVDVAQVEHHGSGTAHAGGVYVESINPLFAIASSGTHEGDENPRWRAIAKYLGYKKFKEGIKQQIRTVRLRTDMAEHLVEAYDENKKLVEYKLWKPHEKKGFYSTRSNGDVCFTVNALGELRLDNKTKG